MDWSHVDYCDVFISCLDSHSDSPYPLVILAMDVIPKKQIHLGWSESEWIFSWKKGKKILVSFYTYKFIIANFEQYQDDQNEWLLWGKQQKIFHTL